MKWKSDAVVQRTVLISRRIFWVFFIIFFLLAGLIRELAEFYKLNWLLMTTPFIGGISLTLLAISWIMPGILILLRLPWLARAWLRGVNPIAVTATPWEQLSSGQKFLTYVWSLVFSGFTLLAITGLIIQAFRKWEESCSSQTPESTMAVSWQLCKKMYPWLTNWITSLAMCYVGTVLLGHDQLRLRRSVSPHRSQLLEWRLLPLWVRCSRQSQDPNSLHNPIDTTPIYHKLGW